jgi:hypothetical protein
MTGLIFKKFISLKKVIFIVCFFLTISSSVSYGQKHKKSGAVHHQYSSAPSGKGIPVIRNIRAGLKKSISHKGYDSGAGLETYYLNLGVSSYYGDLCDNYSCMIFRPNFGISYMYRYNSRVSFRVEANYYRLSSKDVYTKRDLSFRSGNIELYAGGIYDLIAFSKRYKKRKFITPYVFGGFGVTYFNPAAQYQGKWYYLEPLHTEGNSYSRFTAIIPFGLGLRIKASKGIDLMLEAGYRKTFTDRLDDVSSHKYQPLASFSDPVAAALSNRSGLGDNNKGYRGNPGKKDGYFILQLKISYTPKLQITSVPRYRQRTGTRQ